MNPFLVLFAGESQYGCEGCGVLVRVRRFDGTLKSLRIQ